MSGEQRLSSALLKIKMGDNCFLLKCEQFLNDNFTHNNKHIKRKDLSQAPSGREEQGAANRSQQKRTENNSLTITMANCLFK